MELPAWVGFCAWRIRKAASARRPPPSIWPSGLALAGGRTLLVDLDPQCNATSGLGHKPAGTASARFRRRRCESRCVKRQPPSLELLPGSRNFQDVEALAGPRQPDGHAAATFGQRTERLRFRADRLPAIAGAIDPHRPGQLDRSADADPVRVLRDGRAGADDRSHSPGDARKTQAAGSSAESC